MRVRELNGSRPSARNGRKDGDLVDLGDAGIQRRALAVDDDAASLYDRCEALAVAVAELLDEVFDRGGFHFHGARPGDLAEHGEESNLHAAKTTSGATLDRMSSLLLLSDRPASEALPALRTAGFDHKVEALSTQPARVAEVAPLAVLVDCRDPREGFAALLDLAGAGPAAALIAIVASEALEAHPWDSVADELLSPAVSDSELRLRLSMLRRRRGASDEGAIRLGPVVIDPATYKATNQGVPLDLTYREFELLRFLAANPGKVFSRESLLQQVWGYDFYGGTRTVDVHIRRLRAKLGITEEHLIETVRGVGYRAAGFVL